MKSVTPQQTLTRREPIGHGNLAIGTGNGGNNHYYQGKTPEISTAGTYYYTFRFRIDEGTYAYAGTDGLWNGTSSTYKTFQVTM